MLLYNKRAELTTTQIVGLVVLILSFVIILFLIFQLNLGETSQKELCRDSVILKGKSLLPTGQAPLNCKSEYVCFSKTDSCGDKTYERIVKVNSKNGFYRALADEMADCWWMFGEGKIDYIGSEFVPDFYCSMCSTIYFDSSVKEIFGADNFSQKELYDFMVNNNMSSNNKLGYDQYLYQGIDLKNSQQFLDSIENEYSGKNAGFPLVNLDSTYVILMGIWSKTSTLSWVGLGVGIVLIAPFALFSITGAIIAVTVTGATYGASEAIDYFYSGTSLVGDSGLEYLRPVLVEKRSEYFDAYKCEHILTRD